MPRFDKNRKYKNKNGHVFGSGVWVDDNGKLILPGKGIYDRKSKTVKQYNSDGKTENLFYRYNYPREVFLPEVIVTPKRKKK